MSAPIVLSVVVGYFIFLLAVAWYTSRGASDHSFFSGDKNSRWYVVAYGMIGTSLSGITFMSVPGEVGTKSWAYMQIVFGYFFGYLVIARVLLPLYYKMNLTSIYSYLDQRFGGSTYRTGSFFFLVSRSLGASLRVFLVVKVLQEFVLGQWNIPFFLTAVILMLLILLYTFRGGVKTIVWTDTIQTTFMLLALVLSMLIVSNSFSWGAGDLVRNISTNEHTRIFFFDWRAPNFFLKQFLSGMFITIVMTGLDQEMMQKNISCRSLKEAQKNMMVFSLILVGVNFLFLCLGTTLWMYAERHGISVGSETDKLFPTIALGYLGQFAALVFLIGFVSALFPSADGALTALTTSFCIDILWLQKKNLSEHSRKITRYLVHISFAVLLLLCVLGFSFVKDKSVISLLFTIAGFTYGPLLGLYAFGLFGKRAILDRWSWIPCLAAPVTCFFLNKYSAVLFGGYKFGFELLLVNGLITFIGLLLFSKSQRNKPAVSF